MRAQLFYARACVVRARRQAREPGIGGCTPSRCVQREIKVLVVGNSGVGKTSMVRRFCRCDKP